MDRTISYSLFIDYFLYLLVRLIDEAFNLLPERTARDVGIVIGRLIWILMPGRRAIALENLTIAFGEEKAPKWIRETARRSFEHLGQMAVEFFITRRWPPEVAAEKVVVHGAQHLNLAMMPGTQGVCAVSGHVGCFEAAGLFAKFIPLKGYAIGQGVSNPFLSRYLLGQGRGRGSGTGFTILPHRGIVHDVLRLLRQGNFVAFLGDQRGQEERGIFVNFFGKKAPANEIFARFIIEGKARVLPALVLRREDGRYDYHYFEEIPINLTGDRLTDLTNVSQELHNVFERMLREHPEQGFWLHNKWKRRPARRRRWRRKKAPV